MIRQNQKFIYFLFICCSLSVKNGSSQTEDVTFNQKTYPLYPKLLTEKPIVSSPFTTETGREFLVTATENRKFAIFPVTVENGEPWLHQRKRGKGNQLSVDADDFPVLAREGLHAEAELKQTRMITGRSLAEITSAARPGCSSGAGFIAQDEDILSVLLGDNRLVKKLDLTHPQLAKPLFHLFNFIRWREAQSSQNAQPELIYYNDKIIHLANCHSGKGWQESIFDDEILGFYQFDLYRDLDAAEKLFLMTKYQHLAETEMAALLQKLTHLHTGEMVAFYIMRYGFYEGHTSYRADPVVLAFLFGLKTVYEIEAAFPGQLPDVLTRHFTRKNIKTGE